MLLNPAAQRLPQRDSVCKISQLQCQQLLLCAPQAALRRQHGQVITNTRLIATQANIDRLLLSFNILALCIQLLFAQRAINAAASALATSLNAL